VILSVSDLFPACQDSAFTAQHRPFEKALKKARLNDAHPRPQVRGEKYFNNLVTLVPGTGKPISELAGLIGTTNQNLSNKLSRDNFSEQELIQIATDLGCRFEGYFIFDDGEKI